MVVVIITEFIFQEINIFLSYGQFILALFLILFIQFISAWEESIQKYLFEYNKSNPFAVLMLEGVFGFILSFIFSLFYSPFDDLIQFKKKESNSKFVILIFALILYLLLSGGKSAFRIVTTKIYSPMTTTFMDYILNPFYIIYYFFSENDFISYGKRNYAYFVINLIISLILSFCGCIYNEFLILFFWGLERETYRQVTKRANLENEMSVYNYEDDEESLA